MTDNADKEGSTKSTQSADEEGSNKSVPGNGSAKNGKKNGIKMDSHTTRRVHVEIHRSRLAHSLAAKYFKFRQFWFFTFPKGLMVAIASFLAFYVATTVNEESSGGTNNMVVALIVGAINIIVGFSDILSETCMYGTRAAMHDSVSIDLRDLGKKLRLLRIKLGHVEKKEESADQDDCDQDVKNKFEHDTETFEQIQSRYEQTLSGCKSICPMPITDSFDHLHSDIGFLFSVKNKSNFEGKFGETYNDNFEFASIDHLVAIISARWYFPMFLPYPKKAVIECIKSLDERLKELEELCNTENYNTDNGNQGGNSATAKEKRNSNSATTTSEDEDVESGRNSNQD